MMYEMEFVYMILILYGFELITSINGCDNTSDFFLKNGIIKKAELLNGNVSKENAEKDKENKNEKTNDTDI